MCLIQFSSFLKGNKRVELEKVPKAPQSFSQSKLIDVCGTLCGLFVYLSLRVMVYCSLISVVTVLVYSHSSCYSSDTEDCARRPVLSFSIAIDLIKGESPRKPTEPDV